MVNFRANLINYTTIIKQNSDNKYSRSNVAFVELDRMTPNDAKSINKVSKLWNYGRTLAEDIAIDLSKNQKNFGQYNHLGWDDGKRFFAITAQDSDFYQLDPKKVLGLAEMNIDSSFPDSVWLEYLQVNPEYKHSNTEFKKYKGIGECLVKSLLKTYSGLKMYLDPVYSAIGFYRKCGFKMLSELNMTSSTMTFVGKIKP